MDLKDRFFGKGLPQPGGLPVANVRITDPPSFQLLYSIPLDLDADALTLALREYHPELASATAELLHVPAPSSHPGPAGGQPAVLGLIAWERHVVKVVGFNAPMPVAVVRGCVQPAHYDPALKEEAYQHVAHVMLYYAGYESDPLEQHVALAAAAAALTPFGAVVAMNETAHVSIPAMALLPHEEDEGDTLKSLRSFPLPYLYAGFVMVEVDEIPGVWMRTYGCQAFHLPNLALRAAGTNLGPATFNLFSNMLAYLRRSGGSFAPGDTMGVGEGEFFRFRARTTDEWFLESEGEMLVVERIPATEVNS